MRKFILLFSFIIAASCLSGCSNSENDDPFVSIVGTWELKTLCYPGSNVEIPLDKRDLFIFSSSGQVKVIKKMRSFFPNFPNEDGEYDYSYDKEKQIILLCGKTRKCIITDDEMNIDSGLASADSEPIQNYLFIKTN